MAPHLRGHIGQRLGFAAAMLAWPVPAIARGVDPVVFVVLVNALVLGACLVALIYWKARALRKWIAIAAGVTTSGLSAPWFLAWLQTSLMTTAEDSGAELLHLGLFAGLPAVAVVLGAWLSGYLFGRRETET